MLVYAQKVRSHGCERGCPHTASLALLLLALRKNDEVTTVILHRHPLQTTNRPQRRYEMICFSADGISEEEAVRRYWSMEGVQNEFPGYESPDWQETTPWLDAVAASGIFEQFGYQYDSRTGRHISSGAWTEVVVPKYREVQGWFENPERTIRDAKDRLAPLNQARDELRTRLLDLMECSGELGGRRYLPEAHRVEYAVLESKLDEVLRQIREQEKIKDDATLQQRMGRFNLSRNWLRREKKSLAA